jgi:predicted deacylase
MIHHLIIPRLKQEETLIIDKEPIQPGVMQTIRINAGKLPSDNRINVFAHVLHTNVKGPSLLVLGGVHGNEINGIEIVRRSLEQQLYQDIHCGTVIVIPLLNVFGFINFRRDVPDGKDVNRSFPGHANGSLASRIARILTKKILPHTDLALDYHTGGDARYNFPHVRYTKSDKIAQMAAHHMGVKYLVEQPMIAHSFRKAAHDMKVPAVVFEGGESIRMDQEVVEAGINSIKYMLKALGMAEHLKINRPTTQYVIHKNNWIRANAPGLFIRHTDAGNYVHKGEKIGEIKDPYGTKSTDVISNYAGHIIGHNNASVVSLGEALFHVGYEYSTL